MSTDEQTGDRYGDFPELFWDPKRDAPVDARDPAIIARLPMHAPPETLWKLVPVPVLLEQFDQVDLPDRSRKFWSVVVQMLRERRTRRGQAA
ncbi:MAG TPA: hypothetical protein VHG93_15260 [Longimicrobium sp.]|nr:hypothetical protein [Longimicrobium sp.]